MSASNMSNIAANVLWSRHGGCPKGFLARLSRGDGSGCGIGSLLPYAIDWNSIRLLTVVDVGKTYHSMWSSGTPCCRGYLPSLHDSSRHS